MSVASRHNQMYMAGLYLDLNPKLEPEKESLTPTKDLQEVHIGPREFHTTKLGTSVTEAGEEELVPLLKKKIN